MNQIVALEGHLSFGAISATATLQRRLDSSVVAEPSPALRYLRRCNPLGWSENDSRRLGGLLGLGLDVLRVLGWFFFLRS